MMLELRTARTAAELSARLAGDLLQLLHTRLAAKPIVTVVLTGGTMGISLLESLADHPKLLSIDWQRVRLLWGDERWVKSDSADRNCLQADHALLSKLPLNAQLVHPIPASDSGVDITAAADSYARLVDSVLAAEGFDLVLLGVGPDGHVASIFPGQHADVTTDSISSLAGKAAYPVTNSPKPPAQRITLSMAALNCGAEVWLLFSGESKKDSLNSCYAELLSAAGYNSNTFSAKQQSLPAAMVSGTERTLVYADYAALPSGMS